jgi:hypothetical protein
MGDGRELAAAVADQPWVKGLGECPRDEVWPRLMTGPHPLAVGSFGDQWLAFVRSRLRWEPYWWQQLVAFRLLEFDAVGDLVWLWALVSTSRQVGKSTVLRSLAMFRVASPEVFAWDGVTPQNAFLGSTTLKLANETMRPALAWADGRPGWRAYRGASDTHVEAPDGGRWLLGPVNASHGFTINNPITDEAWGVDPVVVEDHMEPTMLAADRPQFLITSTAHQNATLFVPAKRAQALDELATPDDLLIVEWSAPAEVDDILDERGWRAASPRWTPQRERFLRSKVGKPGNDVMSFRTQHLNQWPDKGAVLARTRLADPIAYASSEGGGPTGYGDPVVVAVEDWFGSEGSVAVAEVDRGKVRVSGRTFPTRSAAWDYVDWFVTAFGEGDIRVLVGASLSSDPRVESLPVSVDLRGMRETRTALGLYRSLLRDGVLIHDADAPDLTRQLLDARLASSSTSGLRFDEHGERHDLASAAVWAIQEAATTFGMVGVIA